MKRFNISFKAVSGIERHLKRDSSIRGGQRGTEGCLFQSIPERFFNIGYLADPVDTRSLIKKDLPGKRNGRSLFFVELDSLQWGNFERIGGSLYVTMDIFFKEVFK